MHVLQKGDTLTVVAEKDTFAVVRLPAAAPCWVAAEFVQLAADGKSYTVTGDNVNLRCTPDTRYYSIGQIGKGATLAVVMDGQTGKPAAENEFVKVSPPRQATGAVALEFLERVGDAPAEADPAPASAPAEPVAAPKEKPKREPTATELEDERKAFAALEKLLREELAKPALEVDLTGIRKLFEQFKEFSLDPKVSEKAAAHIDRIDSTVRLIEAEKKRLAEEAARRQAELDRLRDEAMNKGEKTEKPAGPVEYIAKGTIGSTGKNAKTPASHRLFDADGKVIYDLRWDKGDLGKLMGSHVGIVGTVRQYEGWPYKVLVIERIDVLAAEEEK
jgi:hypothetical protein